MPAAAGFRKVIDIATLALDPTLKSRQNLEQRIDALYEAGKLSAGLRGLAHVIRLDGNEEVHEPDLTDEAEASQLKDFTELFLTYVFTMPAAVSKAVARRPKLAAKIEHPGAQRRCRLSS
jgi:hypothetical protein